MSTIKKILSWMKQSIDKENKYAKDAPLLDKIKPYTMLDPQRLQSIQALALQVVKSEIPGDFVECGTYKGGVSALLSQYLDSDRRLWLFDSFEGLPEATIVDGSDAMQWTGKCAASIKDLEEVMSLVEADQSKVKICKGWFEDTLREEQNLPSTIALIHCDADWYESVSLVLESLYSRLSPGGCFILDDFGYWEGCREAFYDFCCRTGEKPLLERVNGQAYWIKDRQHSRPVL